MNWKQSLLTAREAYMKAHYAACRDFGVPVKKYGGKTANGLTACIMDFLKYHNCYCNRINTMGTPRKGKDGRMTWTKGTTRRGTADIDAIIHGNPVKIEVKIGKDRMSDAQHQEKARIEAAGGIYIVAKSMEDFYNWYNSFVNDRNYSIFVMSNRNT